MKKVLNPVEFYLDLLKEEDSQGWGYLMSVYCQIAAAMGDLTVYHSRIEGCLDPFWRHP